MRYSLKIVLVYLALTATRLVGQTAPQDTTKGQLATARRPPPERSQFSFWPSLSVSIQNTSTADREELSLQWLADLQVKYTADGTTMQFRGNLLIKYGQLCSRGAEPQKVQDMLILSCMPSLMVSRPGNVRLFLETTMESYLGAGMVDTIRTGLMDPFFMYQTLYLGQKVEDRNDSATQSLDLMYGIGYAFQQTLTSLPIRRAIVVDRSNPLFGTRRQLVLESGLTGMLELNYSNQVTDKLLAKLGVRAVAHSRDPFGTATIAESRFGGLATLSLQYGVFALDYTGRLVYDGQLSLRRQLNQTLTLGIRLEL